MLKGDEIPEEAAGALIVLIPKEEKSKSVRSFKPISLCNICTKLMTKVIDNRLKEILKDIISPSRVSFIHGRQAIGNVVIFQEIIHSLRHIKARRGGMMAKIDLEKAYDIMEWTFMEETLIDASLPKGMINVIIILICLSHCKLT